MRALGILPISAGGTPDLGGLPYGGWCLVAYAGNWGAYILSGTPAQLSAINALPNTYAICTISAGGAIHLQSELNNTIAPAVRTKINNWLSARGYPNIPAGWTYRQVILAIFRRMNDHYDIEKAYLIDA